ncbi:MAG: MarR family transcriptional regulator [Tissierellia bacterium]|nr:MarR family transcriptional regulator [Tissierellia bacterium]
MNVGLNKTETKVIHLLIENTAYNAEELAEKIGVTKRTIERTFVSLQEKGFLERVGSKRDGRWMVIK